MRREERLQRWNDAVETVKAYVDTLNHVDAVQSRRHKIAMVGDESNQWVSFTIDGATLSMREYRDERMLWLDAIILSRSTFDLMGYEHVNAIMAMVAVSVMCNL